MMNLVLKPSLEHRALVKTAVSLWNQDDVGALISLAKVKKQSSEFLPMDEEWKEMEGRVLERVAQLPLPQLLNEKLSCFVQAIGLEIYKWIEFHCIHYDFLPLNLPLELCWTPQGTVDGKRTAEVLVRDESLDLSTRYKLACVYFLEDSIHELWNSMPEDLRKSYWARYPAVAFWSHTMRRRELGPTSISYKNEFRQYLYGGHKAIVEYFLQKLSPRERGASLVKAAKCFTDSDPLCFSLSQMDEEQQMEVFKNDPQKVLRCFLQWPWQSFFMEIANRMWDFISKKDYDSILRHIIDKVRRGHKDCNYHELFREFWQKSPHALKSLMTDEISQLLALFRIKDEGNIRFILQGATATAREKLIYSDNMKHFCQDCIYRREWDSLEIFIRECFPSKDLMLRYKEEFEYHIKWMSVEDILMRNKDKWDKIFLSSDDSLREYEKSAEEGESRSFKRFRSLE